MQTKNTKPATRASPKQRGRPQKHQAQGDDHPTRDALIRAALALLETLQPDELTLDKILVAGGVSKGSLYHQFADLNALIDEALLLDFGRGVYADIEAITHLTKQADSKLALARGLRLITQPATRLFGLHLPCWKPCTPTNSPWIRSSLPAASAKVRSTINLPI